MDGVMWAMAQKKSQWKEDLYCAVKVVQQKRSKYYAPVTPTTGVHLISAHILHPRQKLRLFTQCNKGMDINLEDETSYTIQ